MKARCDIIDDNENAALALLRSTGVDVLEAALVAKEALEAARGQLNRAKQCVRLGAEELAKRERTVSFAKAVEAALEARKGRRARTQTDFRYVCKRLMARNPELKNRRIRSMTARECERYLATAFETPQQLRKGRAVMSGVFSTAIRNEWCDVNPVAKVAVPQVQEHEVGILKPVEIKTLLEVAKTYENGACLPAVGLMLYAGIRPHEVTRLTYSDVDWENGCITIRARHSKTGGARRVDMAPPLRRLLSEFRGKPRHEPVCPKKWSRHWAELHTRAGWNNKKPWQPDILRHTFASTSTTANAPKTRAWATPSSPSKKSFPTASPRATSAASKATSGPSTSPPPNSFSTWSSPRAAAVSERAWGSDERPFAEFVREVEIRN